MDVPKVEEAIEQALSMSEASHSIAGSEKDELERLLRDALAALKSQHS